MPPQEDALVKASSTYLPQVQINPKTKTSPVPLEGGATPDCYAKTIRCTAGRSEWAVLWLLRFSEP